MLVLAAFLAMVAVGGVNFLAVRFSNDLLDPFGGAALRFGLASIAFLAWTAIARVPLPRGRALLGAALYGALGFGGGYAFAYWALAGIGAGTASVLMALVPLLTVLLASGHGIEPFRWRGLAGGVIAAAGVALIFAQGRHGGDPTRLAAMLGAAFCAAESGVVAKRFPRSHPAATNAVGMAVGAALLLLVSLAAGETRALPPTAGGWVILAYLVGVGSLGLFVLFLYVLHRWTATGTSYMFVLSPLVAVPLGALAAGEALGPSFLGGGALVVVGVWVGALASAPAPSSTPAGGPPAEGRH